MPTLARYAFVTLVTTDEYLPAGLVLAHSLRHAHSAPAHLSSADLEILGSSEPSSVPQLGPWTPTVATDKPISMSQVRSQNVDLVALVTPASLSVQSIRALLRVYDRVVGVEALNFDSIFAMRHSGQVKGPAGAADNGAQALRQSLENLSLLGRVDLGSKRGAPLSKLHAWRLQEYSKIVFLDADTLVLQPIAHMLGSEAIFAACPDTGWPDIFNSGVMILSPAKSTFDGLLELAAEGGSWDGADQGLINEYFGGEAGRGSEGCGGGWTRLSFAYNVTTLGGYMYAPAFQRHRAGIKVAHFVGEKKPWKSRRPSSAGQDAEQARQGNMAAFWWEVYGKYYPVSGASTPSSRYDGLEVRFDDRGVELIDRVSAHGFQVPVYHAAWESPEEDATSTRAATLDKPRKKFGLGRQTCGLESSDGGKYESLPLFERSDLLPPSLPPAQDKKQSRDPPANTFSCPQELSSVSLSANATPAPNRVTWDAAFSSPLRGSYSEKYQVHNPTDTYFTNVWDQPAESAAQVQAERERRRQFFDPNSQSLSRHFGYIPPEAKEIHTFHHLGGEKPDKTKITVIFPWEKRVTTNASQVRGDVPTAKPADAMRIGGHTGTGRMFLGGDDSSLRHGSALAMQTSRRFDNYVVSPTRDVSSSPTLSSSPSASASKQALPASMPFNLVQRYSNAWAAEPAAAFSGSKAAQDRIEGAQQRDRVHISLGRGAAPGSQHRRQNRSDSLQSARGDQSEAFAAGATSSSGRGGTGVPTAYHSAASGTEDPAVIAAMVSRRYRWHGSTSRPNSMGYGSTTTAPYCTPASSNFVSATDSTSSECEIDESNAAEYNFYTRQLGFSNPIAGIRGNADGLRLSSWTREANDFVRRGSPGGCGPAPGTFKSTSTRSLRHQIQHEFSAPAGGGGGDSVEISGSNKYEGSEEDGDDESSSNDSRGSLHTTRRRHLTGQLSADHTVSDTSEHLCLSSDAFNDTVLGANKNGSVAPGGHGLREGSDYTRRAQASSFVRSHAAPKSTRNAFQPLLGGNSGSNSTIAPTATKLREPAADALAPAPPLTGRARIKPEWRSSYSADR